MLTSKPRLRRRQQTHAPRTAPIATNISDPNMNALRSPEI